MPIRLGYVDTRIGQIHYRTAGSAGPIVVLLHQTASSSRMYEALMTQLEGEFRFVALDTPGFGGSAALPEPPSVEDFADVLAEAVAALGHETYHLFGHHTGGAIATAWAAAHPERVSSLTVVGGLAMGSEARAQWLTAIHPAPLTADGAHFVSAWHRVAHIDAEPVLSPPDAALRHREAVDVLIASPRWPEAYLAVFQHDYEASLRAVACPLLIMCGPEDILWPYFAPALALRPDARSAELPGGAYALDQHTAEVARHLVDFLASPPSAGGENVRET
jgi:pimeloyl-ACP methyl ester carboxylesterase